MIKNIFAVIGLVIVVGIAFSLLSIERTDKEASETEVATEKNSESQTQSSSIVTDGSYVAVVEDSKIFWSGKKPLIDGYINKGSIRMKDGSITIVDCVITGEFTIDMNSLSVSETLAKPGKESALEGHLKGEGWFNVEEFPEAKFVIKEVVPQEDNKSSFLYDIVGDLTMKGVTNELKFPALVYAGADGRTYASASLEFDRTKWGITSGSGSFFDNLADNVIDDMVALSFELVTKKR